MKDERKTKKQLIEELNELRQQAIKQGSSETKLAGNALIESEARIQSIFRAAPTGIGLVSNRIILEVNDKLCEMLGYSRDELIGKKSQILYLSDEDYEWVGQEKYKQIQEHGTGTVEIRWKRKDGKTIEVILSSTPLDLADLSLGVTFSALDISERVQAEEELGESEKRYNSLVKNSPLGILSADREGNILAVNPAIINMLGSPSYEKTVEINLLSFPLLVEVGFADDALRCMESITTINTECQYITAWGKEVFFKYHLTPLLEGHDLVIGFQAIFEDITERKQAKDALQDSEERFRTLSQATFEGIVISEGGVITDANQQIADILGYDQSDLIGIRIEEYVAPEDFDFVQKHVLMGSETSYEHQALHKDGSSVILEVHPKMMEIRGKKNRVAAVRDITSRKKAENLLVESRNYLNSILDGMGEGLMVVDLNYEITDVNSSFSKNYAKSKEELIGKKCYEITHQLAQPCNTSKHKCPLKQVVSTKTPLKVDHLHHSPVTGEQVVEIHGFPLIGPEGEVVSMVEVINDVTERVDAENKAYVEAGRANALTRIASRFNTHLDVETIVAAICEEISQVLAVPLVTVCLNDRERNKFSLAGQFGFSLEHQANAQSLCDYYQEISQPSDPIEIIPNIQTHIGADKFDLFFTLDIQTTVSAIIQRDDRVIGRLIIFTVEEERHFSKEDIAFLMGLSNQAAIALENARLFQSERVSRHESEALRKMSLAVTSTMAMDQVLERILAELQEVVPYDTSSVQLLEDDQLILVISRGFSKSTNLVGVSFSSRGSSRYNQVLESRKPFNDTKENQSSWLGVPLMIGERVIGLITLSKDQPGFYTDKHGQIVMAFAAAAAIAVENARLFKDLQDQMQILKETRTLLMQTEKLSSIGKLVAGIAHELNNPIATILLLAQQSLQEEDIQETTSNLTKIVSESKRTANIVGDLLLFSRQQVQEHELQNINEILTNVLDNLAPAIEMNNIKISFELYKDLPSILIDSDQIQQVIINIVNNACQSMSTDPKNYTLKIITEMGPSIYLSKSKMVQVVRIKFQDSGSGIHPDVLPRIFDPFFTTKKLEQGTGLGLSICHGIISEHGGHIWAESEYGQGATFFVELPIKTINSPLPAIEDKQVKPPMVASGYKILIIDDEQNLLEIISRVLKRRGFQVNAASNGEDGLTLALEISPDLILCDLLMPGVSGKDVYNQLKERAPELLNKIIFITGDSVSKESSQFLMETEIPYLNKPFELDFLIEFVEKAVLGEHKNTF